MLVALDVIAIDGVAELVTVISTLFEFAVAGVAQVALDVNCAVTTSLFAKVEELKLVALTA
jgi:hypothetical protein